MFAADHAVTNSVASVLSPKKNEYEALNATEPGVEILTDAVYDPSVKSGATFVPLITVAPVATL